MKGAGIPTVRTLEPDRVLNRIFRISGWLAVLAVSLGCCAARNGVLPPNIVFILADDLGYGDLGSFGQRIIHTPRLDRLAAEGMRFTQHYAGNAVCAPSRCVLMTGKHPGHAFIRDNKEVGDFNSGQGQWPMPEGEPTLASRLKAAGYATAAYGKWGLGGVGSAGDPLKHGFDRFFGFNDQRAAHNYYPNYLVEDQARLPLPGNDSVITQSEVRLALDANPLDPASYARFTGQQYAPDLCCARALTFIRAHKDRPFFLYFPTPVPHLALQVPADSLAEYQGRLEDKPYVGGQGYLPQQFPHAAYAAMITRLDRDVGRLVDLVNELGLDERTIFIFTSDNGAVYPLGGVDPDYFKSNGSLRGFKGGLYEGGLRVPLIVRWKGHIAAARISNLVTGFEDWVPTLLEVAGVTLTPPLVTDGISFVPTWFGRHQLSRKLLYREFPGYGGQQMVRVGDWKLIRQHLLGTPQKSAAPTTELYHLAVDPAEQHDVAATHPAVVARLAKIMNKQHSRSNEFPFAALDGEPNP